MIPIRRRLYESLAGFTPRQLFAAIQGAWLEPVVGNIWQENTGVTPTTTGGQTIGLLLDQSQGAVLGPELISNPGPFAATTGWTVVQNCALSVSSGNLRVTASGASLIANTAFSTVVGTGYAVEFTIASTQAGIPFYVAIKTAPTSGFIVSLARTAGTYTYKFIATTTTTYFSLETATNSTNGNVFEISSASVRQIAGNHASQSTAANRPTYQLDSNNLPLARHDATDSLSVSLPNLGGGVFSAAGSVYFATPVGMSALHNQSMGTTYQLPALSTDIYSWIVVPQRLSTAMESRLERYMLRKAGLATPDYLTDDSGSILTDDIGDPLLAG